MVRFCFKKNSGEELNTATSDGQYKAKSAYDIQFGGTFCSFRPKWIWSAYAEPKHRFFTWLLVQEKILTADKLQDRNWPSNPLCSLCKLAPKTTKHICLECSFAQKVWELVQVWTRGLVRKLDGDMCIEEWWTQTL